jgi:methyl coenzyme M reductase alpha subunit
MKSSLLIFLLLFAGITCTAAGGERLAEEEKRIELSDAPEAVQSTIESFLHLLPEGAELQELVVETEEMGRCFEGLFQIPDSSVYEVEMDPRGKILEIEMDGEDGEDD